MEFQTKMFLTSYKFPGQDPSKKNHQILSLNVLQDIEIEWSTWNLLNHIKARTLKAIKSLPLFLTFLSSANQLKYLYYVTSNYLNQ